MVKVTKVYVERLKSYGDYSNRKLGVEAELSEGEDFHEVYLRLAKEVETLLELQHIEADKEIVEARRKILEERKEKLEAVREELRKLSQEIREEFSKLEEELENIEKLIEERKPKLTDEIIEKLRKIRAAIAWYDDP